MSAPNQLLDMAAVRELLGMDQDATGRTIRRRLRSVAEARGATDFWLGKLGGAWFTTDQDMRALVPELYAYQNRGAETVIDVVRDVVAELASLRKRLAATECAMLALRTAPAPRALPVRRPPVVVNPGQLELPAGAASTP